LKKWGIKEDEKGECGEEQDADLFVCPLLSIKCRKEDFLMTINISDKAIQIAAYWEGNMKIDTRRRRITI